MFENNFLPNVHYWEWNDVWCMHWQIWSQGLSIRIGQWLQWNVKITNNIVTTKLDLNLHWHYDNRQNVNVNAWMAVQSCKHARLHLPLDDNDFATIASITWAEERELERHQTKQKLQFRTTTIKHKLQNLNTAVQQIQYMTQGWKLLIWGAD